MIVPGPKPDPDSGKALVEGQDYYWEGAVIVFTASYHLRRGYCCESGCRHCPYKESGEAELITSDPP